MVAAVVSLDDDPMVMVDVVAAMLDDGMVVVPLDDGLVVVVMSRPNVVRSDLERLRQAGRRHKHDRSARDQEKSQRLAHPTNPLFYNSPNVQVFTGRSRRRTAHDGMSYGRAA